MGGGRSDEIKGRVKEAVGSLIDDEELKRKGRVDQAAGKIKKQVGKAVDTVKDALAGKKEKKKPR